MRSPARVLGRELLSHGWTTQAELCLCTGLPSWKISRLFKRFELLGFIKVKQEPRFTRGRPRKLCRLTASGIEYFTSLLREARDGGDAESRALSLACGGKGRR
jgi:DNA-binding MarR family transcriptional regulator